MALEQWPAAGTPANPVAWLVSTGAAQGDRPAPPARAARARSRTRSRSTIELSAEEDDAPVPEDRLRLIFTCCHPALALEAQVALTLRTLGGLSTEEIARAFLVPAPTMAQRLVRAKAKIRGARIPYQVPPDEALAERLEAVMVVVYLVFNEGYAASFGARLVRHELCEQAIRLGRMLVELLPAHAEPKGLLALMLLHDSRRETRLDESGRHRAARGPGPDALGPRADRGGRGAGRGRAARRVAGRRARTRCRRPSPPSTPRRPPPPTPTGRRSPRSTACSRACTRRRWSSSTGPSRSRCRTGSSAGSPWWTRSSERGELAGYHLLPVAQAELLRRLGRHAEAAEAYRRALGLVEQRGRAAAPREAAARDRVVARGWPHRAARVLVARRFRLTSLRPAGKVRSTNRVLSFDRSLHDPHRRRARMPFHDPDRTVHHLVSRRRFLEHAGVGAAGMAAVISSAGRAPVFAQSAPPPYPDWIPVATKPPKRGRRPHAGLGLGPARPRPPADAVGRPLPVRRPRRQPPRALRVPRRGDAAPPTSRCKGDLAESWQASPDYRVWTFKLRQGVKWHNVPPLNGRELVAADIKYCFEAYAKEGVQSFTFREVEGIETPDKYTVRVHLQDAERAVRAQPGRAHHRHLPARGAGGGRRPQEAHDRHRALHPEGAHAQGARGAGAEPRLLRQGPPVRRRVHHPLHAGRRDPHGGVPHGAERHHLAGEPRRGGDGAEDESHRRHRRRITTRWRRSGWRWRRTSRRSTTCGCGAPSPWPSTGRSRWTRSSRATASSAGACRTSTTRTRCRRPAQLGPWWQYRPAEAKKLLAEAGPSQRLRDDAVLLRVLPADDVADPARPAGSQEEPQHRRQDHQARLHDATTAATSTASGTGCRGGSSRATRWASTSGRTSTCTRSRRRTSSASTIPSSTS